MTVLIAGLIIFIAVHLLPSMPMTRQRLQKQVGAGPYRGLFSLIAVAGFALIVWGYGLSRLDPMTVYTLPLWLRNITYLLMLLVIILLMETGLPGRIAAAVKHPMLLAVKIWAVAHLLVNGTVADLLLFGSFLAFGVFDRISLKKRDAAVAIAGPNATRNDIISIVGGVAVYAIFIIWLHPILIGVPVF